MAPLCYSAALTWSPLGSSSARQSTHWAAPNCSNWGSRGSVGLCGADTSQLDSQGHPRLRAEVRAQSGTQSGTTAGVNNESTNQSQTSSQNQSQNHSDSDNQSHNSSQSENGIENTSFCYRNIDSEALAIDRRVAVSRSLCTAFRQHEAFWKWMALRVDSKAGLQQTSDRLTAHQQGQTTLLYLSIHHENLSMYSV